MEIPQEVFHFIRRSDEFCHLLEFITKPNNLINLQRREKMKVMDIEGIGPAYAAKLTKAGIRTVEGLLKSGASAKGRKEIAATSGIDQTLVLEWVNRADLYRIKGIGKQYSDLLEKSGVDTVVELSKRVAANLFKKMVEVNEAKNLVNGMPGEKQVGDWIDQAKKLPRIVTY
jgi:predicted flap endonuclease-1-like 5' DNA nuclease